MKAKPADVLAAAAAVEEEARQKDWPTWWGGVAIFCHLFPDYPGYRTKGSGVSASIQTLHRQGKLEKHPFQRGKYRLKPATEGRAA